MKEVEVLKPTTVLRTNYLSDKLPHNLGHIVETTHELDEKHGKPTGSLSDGDVVTLQCVVHDSTLARLVLLPILQSHKGEEPTVGLSVPGMDVELAVRERLGDLIKVPEVPDEEIIINYLKGKLNNIDELKHQSEPSVDLPDDQLDLLMNFDNANGAEKLIKMFIDELSSSN